VSAGDAALAAALLAVDPIGLGGVRLLAGPGLARDAWLKLLAELLPPDMKTRRLPAHVSEDRLLGGLDLTATLRSGKPVAERGLLAEADGGILVAAMAERMRPAVAAHLAGALDRGEIAVERDGFSQTAPARFGIVALDEGIAGEEAPPAALCDRLALAIGLDGVKADELRAVVPDGIVEARRRLGKVQASEVAIETLCAAALALGIWSLRIPALALAAARAHAALRGALSIEEADLTAAARLVLAPRATMLPAPAEEEGPPEQAEQPETEETSDSTTSEDDRPLADRVLDAAAASIPPGLLALLAQRVPQRSGQGGRAGAQIASKQRGRPAGIFAGLPRDGRRLSVIDTLRAAAPWQRLRQSETSGERRIAVRREDLRVVRRKQRSETVTIFAVDASGSSALHRLAEAKGAVELLLAECYVRRDEVALIAFRGRTAELLLPPTRSLLRARRALAELPGGGGTPLAAAIVAMTALAESLRRRGKSPLAVLLTDGRANVARDGSGGRPQAEADAMAAARAARAAGISALLVDTSPSPSAAAQRLAQESGARYLPLPYADATAIARAVQGAALARREAA
jgi:magnesium chelatase subunit D